MAEARGGGGVRPPTDFGRSENGGGSAGAPHYYSPPKIFRPSAKPVLCFLLSFLISEASVFSKGAFTKYVYNEVGRWSKNVHFLSTFIT